MFLVSRKPELFVEEQKKYENQINASSEFMRRDDYMITEDIKYRVFNKNEH
ncbi:MAG: hypothetical protein LBC61_04775 [Candidatus Peribacteria bacterium]|jgi:hypothetical protein|nr:hypothetical protein [Candidatus Peribacteria bacterium]